MISARELVSMVESFDTGDDYAGAKSRELVLGLLEHTPLPLSREQYTPGHITCTGLVLHPKRDAILIIHHQRLGRWLLPGGHVEADDAEAWQTARREVEEETTCVLGPAAAAPLVGLDVHGIPPRKAEPFHLHHDLVFAFRAASPELRATEEVRAAIWHDLADFSGDAYHLPENTKLCAIRAVTLLPYHR